MDSSICRCSTRFSFRFSVFLIYINDLAEGISSTTKLFVDDTSLFSVVNNINESANQMNMDLEKMSLWAYQ